MLFSIALIIKLLERCIALFLYFYQRKSCVSCDTNIEESSVNAIIPHNDLAYGMSDGHYWVARKNQQIIKKRKNQQIKKQSNATRIPYNDLTCDGLYDNDNVLTVRGRRRRDLLNKPWSKIMSYEAYIEKRVHLQQLANKVKAAIDHTRRRELLTNLLAEYTKLEGRPYECPKNIHHGTIIAVCRNIEVF